MRVLAGSPYERVKTDMQGFCKGSKQGIVGIRGVKDGVVKIMDTLSRVHS